ncbi:MAG: site-specific integrase, partial [Phototrophicaceae bacterium]
MNTEIVKEWLINLDQNGKSQHTSLAYHRGIKHFMKWYEEIYEASLDISLVMPRDIRNWKSHQQSIEKVSPATINQRLVAVTNFFQWAK